MDTLTANSKSYIYTIIDDKRHMVLLADFVKLFSNSDLLSCVGNFLTILHDSDSSFQSCLDDLKYVIGSQDSWSLVTDEVE